MSVPQGWREPLAEARNRGIATVKIQRNPQLRILPLIQKFYTKATNFRRAARKMPFKQK